RFSRDWSSDVCSSDLMALAKACSGDAHELGIIVKLGNALRAAIPHTGPQPADQLVHRVGQRSLVGDTAFDAFRYELVLVLLEVRSEERRVGKECRSGC